MWAADQVWTCGEQETRYLRIPSLQLSHWIETATYSALSGNSSTTLCSAVCGHTTPERKQMRRKAQSLTDYPTTNAMHSARLASIKRRRNVNSLEACASVQVETIICLRLWASTIVLQLSNDKRVQDGAGGTTISVMRRLATGIRTEKCVVRRFRRCANVIECTYTNLDSIAYYTPSLYGIAHCS